MYRVFKKRLLGRWLIFTPKMLPVALAMIKPEKCHLLAPQKTPILHENLVIRTIVNVKWVFFDQWD